jgi:hypothetical protein
MSVKIKVDIYGVKEQPVASGGCCSGGCDCGPSQTMGELFDEFVNYVNNSNLKDRIDLHFVDIFSPEFNQNATVMEAMQQGYSLPLTTINGTLMFYGGISNQMIFEQIQKFA